MRNYQRQDYKALRPMPRKPLISDGLFCFLCGAGYTVLIFWMVLEAGR